MMSDDDTDEEILEEIYEEDNDGGTDTDFSHATLLPGLTGHIVSSGLSDGLPLDAVLSQPIRDATINSGESDNGVAPGSVFGGVPLDDGVALKSLVDVRLGSVLSHTSEDEVGPGLVDERSPMVAVLSHNSSEEISLKSLDDEVSLGSLEGVSLDGVLSRPPGDGVYDFLDVEVPIGLLKDKDSLDSDSKDESSSGEGWEKSSNENLAKEEEREVKEKLENISTEERESHETLDLSYKSQDDPSLLSLSNPCSVFSDHVCPSQICCGEISGDPGNDRSISEVSVSVPKLSVISIVSDRGVQSLVSQFSKQDSEYASNFTAGTHKDYKSLPTSLEGVCLPKSAFESLQLGIPLSQEFVKKEMLCDKSQAHVTSVMMRFDTEVKDKPIVRGAEEESIALSIPSTINEDGVYGISSSQNCSLHSDKSAALPEALVEAQKHSFPKMECFDGTSEKDKIYEKQGKADMEDNPESLMPNDDLELLCNIAFPESSLSNNSPSLDVHADDHNSGLRHQSKEREESVKEQLNETSEEEELLEIDIGDSDHEAFCCDDLSDASEIILGFISKSPISAITERTEESGQEGGRSQEEEEEPSSQVESQNEKRDGQGKADHKIDSIKDFGSPLISIGNEPPSSQFTGVVSLTQEEEVEGASTANEQSTHTLRMKTGFHGNLPSKLTPSMRALARSERCASTPPSSPLRQGVPLRASSLHRVTSKSMHNLASGSGVRSRAHILHNRSFSLSTDHLDQSPRAKSLSPGPGYEARARAPGGDPRLSRRCLSAVALDHVEGSSLVRKNQSASLGRLNRSSRSSSMTSITSWRKADYSHVASKVRQYIRDMKDRDLRRSTRSLPTTPARKKLLPDERKESRKLATEEDVLGELLLLEEGNDIPAAVMELRNEILGKGSVQEEDLQCLDRLVQLWSFERALRRASDTTLSALQGHYNDLNTLYAEKQNEIDRLRFFRDVHIYRDYRSTSRLGASDGRRTSEDFSCHTTPPNTPSGSSHVHWRRHSLHTTPPNTPAAGSLIPSLALSTKKTNDIQARQKTPSITGNVREPEYADNSQKQKADDGDNGCEVDMTLEDWIKEANTVLKRVKEFALLEGSAVLQQNEKMVIWNKILSKYWRLSAQFPVVSLRPDSHHSGLLVQTLGQAISGTASRFRLDLVPSGTGHALDDDGETRISSALSGMAKGNGKSDIRDQSLHLDLEGSSDILEKGSVFLHNNVDQPKRYIQGNDGYSNSPGCKDIEDLGDVEVVSPDDNNKPKESLQRSGTKCPPLTLDCGYEVQGVGGGQIAAMPATTAASVSPLSPSHSHTSMKTVGPLEKVTMWQDSLIGSYCEQPPSSSSSVVSSPISLGSTHPFQVPEEEEEEEISLGRQHHQSLDSQGGGKENVQGIMGVPVEGDGLKADVGNPIAAAAWTGDNAITTRLLPCKKTAAVAGRDPDSGCPGSERSTRMSHNPSLEMTTEMGEETAEEVAIKQSTDGIIFRGQREQGTNSPVHVTGSHPKNTLRRSMGKEQVMGGSWVLTHINQGKKFVGKTKAKKLSNTNLDESGKEHESHLAVEISTATIDPGNGNAAKASTHSDEICSGINHKKDSLKRTSARRYASRCTDATSSSSSAEIHGNISKLKRDLTVLKRQMMDLTSEVFVTDCDGISREGAIVSAVDPPQAHRDVSKCVDRNETGEKTILKEGTPTRKGQQCFHKCSHSPSRLRNLPDNIWLSHEGERDRGRSTSPLIYIHNYNCPKDVAKTVSKEKSPKKEEKNKKLKKRSNKTQSEKYHRNGSLNHLMASLDHATTLAERLRLRSKSMLTHLNHNVASAHYEFSQES